MCSWILFHIGVSADISQDQMGYDGLCSFEVSFSRLCSLSRNCLMAKKKIHLQLNQVRRRTSLSSWRGSLATSVQAFLKFVFCGHGWYRNKSMEIILPSLGGIFDAISLFFDAILFEVVQWWFCDEWPRARAQRRGPARLAEPSRRGRQRSSESQRVLWIAATKANTHASNSWFTWLYNNIEINS